VLPQNFKLSDENINSQTVFINII